MEQRITRVGNSIIRYALYAICGTLLITFGAFFVYHSYLALTFPYQLEYGEGPVLDWAARIPRAAPLYKPILSYPYSFPVYTPLYIWLSGLSLPLTPDNFYLGGRVISSLSAVGIAIAIYKTVLVTAENEPRRWHGIIAASLFIASPFARRWATFYRPDMLALCFSLWGYYAVCRYRDSRRLYFSVPLFLLSIYSKHSFVAAPTAAYGWLLLNRASRKRGFIASVSLAASGLGIFALINLTTRGAFFTDIVLANANPYSWQLAGNFMRGFLSIVPILATSALLYLLTQFYQTYRRKKSPRALALYLIAAAFVSLSIGKAGSWENYFLEILAIFCIIAGLWFNIPRWRAVGLLLIIAQLLLYPRGWLTTPWQEAEQLQSIATTRQKLAEVVAAHPDPILAEDMGILAENHRVVPIHTFVYTQLAYQGLWHQEWILTALERQEFSLIIMRAGGRYDYENWHRFSPQMLWGIDRYYAVFATVDGYELYHPAPPLSRLDANFADEITLLGYRTVLDAATNTVTFTLLWQAREDITADYTIFTHLVNSDGQTIIQRDQPPRGGAYPTSRWQAGEVVRDSYTISLSQNVSVDYIAAHVGLYRAATGERLPVLYDGREDNKVVLPIPSGG